MKKRGFTLLELLIVITIMGILVGYGGMSIRKQARARAMLRVRNEIGDFFRVAAKRSLETGKRYSVTFKLEEKIIEIERNGHITDTLKLPRILEYGIKDTSGTYPSEFSTELSTKGNISGNNFTLYVTRSNLSKSIDGDEEVLFAVTFYKGDNHIDYLHIREYITISEFKLSEITSPPSSNSKMKLIKD
jgi:prepilin-type N-terminal cleavage/methylation domain-containing protein